MLRRRVGKTSKSKDFGLTLKAFALLSALSALCVSPLKKQSATKSPRKAFILTQRRGEEEYAEKTLKFIFFCCFSPRLGSFAAQR